MKIHLIEKPPNKNGTTSLMLEYYYGFEVDSKGKIKHKRKYETLDLKLITNPKNAEERNFNKELRITADNILKAKQLDVLKNEYEISPKSKANLNLLDYITLEIDKRTLKKNSLGNYKSIIMHLSEFCNLETTTLKDIDTTFITKYKKYLDSITLRSGKKLKANTKNIYINVLRSMISRAFKTGLIQSNPFNFVTNYKKEETNKQYLTQEEIERLINTDCIQPLIKQAFLFSCFTGLRFIDLQALKWNQIVNEKGKYKLIFKQRKTGGQEYLNLNTQAVKILGKRGNPNDNVFKGLFYCYSMGNALLKWVVSAGITKTITFHSARHSFATLLLSNGVDLYTVSKLLGHKDIKTTQIYAKIINPKLIEAVNKIPNFNL